MISREHGKSSERDVLANRTCMGFALGLAWGLKSFYSHAGFDDLRWVLAPTTTLVTWLTGAAFEVESHSAYLCRARLFAIVPACAGVNFMVVVFVALACGLLYTRRTLGERLGWIVASALAAYGATVLANTARIAIAMSMHETGVSWSSLTPDRMHCAEGVAVYFLFLCATFAFAARVTGARHAVAD
jgi:exosortase K